MDALPPWAMPMPVAEQEFVVDTFRNACMKGKATFKAGQVTKITKKEVHPDYEWAIRPRKDQQIYRLNLSKPAYLITFDQKPGGFWYDKVCRVVARDIPLFATWERVLKVTFTAEQRRTMINGDPRRAYIEFPVPEEGVKLHISQGYGRFVSLQMSAMSEAETREWKLSRVIKKSPISKAPTQ